MHCAGSQHANICCPYSTCLKGARASRRAGVWLDEAKYSFGRSTSFRCKSVHKSRFQGSICCPDFRMFESIEEACNDPLFEKPCGAHCIVPGWSIDISSVRKKKYILVSLNCSCWRYTLFRRKKEDALCTACLALIYKMARAEAAWPKLRKSESVSIRHWPLRSCEYQTTYHSETDMVSQSTLTNVGQHLRVPLEVPTKWKKGQIVISH